MYLKFIFNFCFKFYYVILLIFQDNEAVLEMDFNGSILSQIRYAKSATRGSFSISLTCSLMIMHC